MWRFGTATRLFLRFFITIGKSPNGGEFDCLPDPKCPTARRSSVGICRFHLGSKRNAVRAVNISITQIADKNILFLSRPGNRTTDLQVSSRDPNKRATVKLTATKPSVAHIGVGQALYLSGTVFEPRAQPKDLHIWANQRIHAMNAGIAANMIHPILTALIPEGQTRRCRQWPKTVRWDDAEIVPFLTVSTK